MDFQSEAIATGEDVFIHKLVPRYEDSPLRRVQLRHETR